MSDNRRTYVKKAKLKIELDNVIGKQNAEGKIETDGDCENTGKKSFSQKIAMKNSISKKDVFKIKRREREMLKLESSTKIHTSRGQKYFANPRTGRV